MHAQQQPQGADEQGAGNGTPPPAAPPAAESRPPPLTDPAGMVVYGGKLPPARRLVVSGLSATAIGEAWGPGAAAVRPASNCNAQQLA